MKKITEDVVAPTNSMGTSSSVPGAGAIDTFDPILRRNKIIKRVVNIWKKTKDKT